MKNLPNLAPMLAALAAVILASTLAGCAAGNAAGSGRNLTETQCRDLTALKNNAPLDRQRNASQLAALRRAGYDPSRWFDPYYPDDLQRAQRQVELWYQAECR